jgi:hypothetical protein
MNKFQILVFALFLMLTSNNLFAQDSTRYEVYDVIHLKDGQILKGTILSYDSQLGGISFKDNYGRVYNFSRADYKFFQEKQSFEIKTKKKKTLNERKYSGIRYSLGVNTFYFYGLEKIENDNLNSRKDTRGMGIGLTGTIGKFFTRSHFLGASAEIGTASSSSLYNIGVRYNFEYDDKKSNVSKYIPIELKYQHMFLENSGIDYVEITPNSYYSSSYYPKTQFSTMYLSIGHGFGFIMKHGGSFNIELAYQRHFTLSQKFYNLRPADAVGYNPKFSQINGFRLGFSFSF